MEAVKLNKKTSKKIFIDVYTSWCGWCKVMDSKTFTNPSIINIINQHYYPVKLDAEMKDSIYFNDHLFINPNPNNSRSVHQLAASLLDNQFSYPSTIILDEKYYRLNLLKGYFSPDDLEPILMYYATEINKKQTIQLDEYRKTYKKKGQ